MKFCKTLQRVATASDPSYLPYWPHYKKLKKLIKEIASHKEDEGGESEERGIDDEPVKRPAAYSAAGKETEATASLDRYSLQHYLEKQHQQMEQQQQQQQQQRRRRQQQSEKDQSSRDDVREQLEQNPGEVAFFQVLHAELGKASDFFGKAEREFMLREELVRVGMEVLKRPAAVTIRDRWTILSRAVFVLYKDLLLLETFAIMTYFAFSKILKKHDKVTGRDTRGAFMINVVHKANFTNYPKILEMISNCQDLYNDASQRLFQGMYEDEQLFLYMVQNMGQNSFQPPGLVEAMRQRGAAAPEPLPTTQQLHGPPLSGQRAAATERGDDGDEPESSMEDRQSAAATLPTVGGKMPIPPPPHPPAVYDKAQEETEEDDDDEEDKKIRPFKKRRVHFTRREGGGGGL